MSTQTSHFSKSAFSCSAFNSNSRNSQASLNSASLKSQTASLNSASLILFMMEVLKMASFICKGLNSAKIEIAGLRDSHSIISLQELWLFPNDISLLGAIHPDFIGISVSAMDPSKQLNTGRLYGGVEIMWNRLDNVISSVDMK